jgi:hypothetical protein
MKMENDKENKGKNPRDKRAASDHLDEGFNQEAADITAEQEAASAIHDQDEDFDGDAARRRKKTEDDAYSAQNQPEEEESSAPAAGDRDGGIVSPNRTLEKIENSRNSVLNRIIGGTHMGNGIYAHKGVLKWHGELDDKKIERIFEIAVKAGWDRLYVFDKGGYNFHSEAANKLNSTILQNSFTGKGLIGALAARGAQLSVHLDRPPTEAREKGKNRRDPWWMKWEDFNMKLDSKIKSKFNSFAHPWRVKKSVRERSALENSRQQSPVNPNPPPPDSGPV